MAGPIKIAILADARQAQAAFLKVSAGAEGMGAKIARTGSKLTRSLTLPIAAIGVASIKMSTDFNASMTKIQTQAGASAKDVQTLSKQVLNLATKTQQGPEELAASLFHLKSVGLDNVKAMKALKQSADLAAVGGADLEDTTNALAGAWRSGIKGARNFHGAIGTLNAIIGAGNQTMTDLTDAIGTGFLPSARSFGLSLKSVGSALALMTDEGIPAQVAATRLRMSFSLLGAPSAKAAKLLEGIGLKSDDLAKKMRQGGPHGGLVGAIGLLKDHLQGLNKVQQATLLSNAFGGGRSSSAILTLLNNYDVLVQKQKQIEHTSADVGKAIAAQAKTPQAQFKLLISTIEVLAIKIGNQLLPFAIKAADAMNRFFTAVSQLPTPVKELLGGLAGIAAVTGPLLLIGGSLVRSFVAVAGAVTALGEASIGTRIQLAGLSIMENKLRFGAGIAGIAALTASTKTSNKALSDLLQIGGATATGFAAGGPIGAAIAGGVTAFTILGKHILSASNAAKVSRADYSKLGDTLDSLTGAVTANTRKFVENQLARSGTLKELSAFGVTTRTAISAVLGEGQARKVVSAALKSQTSAIADQRRQIKLLTAANVADEKAGILNPKTQAARKQQIDGYRAQIAAEQNVNNAIRKGIGITKQQIQLKRQDIAATADYSGKLHGLPKTFKTYVSANGIVPTARAIAALAKQYHLTPKQIKTVIAASGVDSTVKQIQRIESNLTDVSKTRPNLSAYKAVLSNQLDQAGGIARTGGVQIGNDLGSGLKSAVSGWTGSIARTSADLVSNAIRAARRAADAHSPSRKMIQLGQDMGEGLILGIGSKIVPLQKVLDKVSAAVQTAASKLKAALQNRNAFASGFQSFATSLFGADFGSDANGNPINPSAAMILAFQRQQAAQAAAVKRDVRLLIRKGLSPALLKQLQAAGPAGFAEIQTLASASPAMIKQLNAANRATSSNLRAAGFSAANDIFGKQIALDRKDAADTKRLLQEIRDLLKYERQHGEKVTEFKIRGHDLVALLKKEKRTTGAHA